MGIIYNLLISLYTFVVRIASFKNEKAAQLIKGQQEVFGLLKKKIDPQARYLWLHASSLGEFEQGRPILERIRKEYPQYKTILTFFSPSGYEVRSDYDQVDIVCYLPFDTPSRVKRFLEMVKPEKAIFVKYEFWPNYLKELKRLKIETVIISAIFRKGQVFFRWYGGWYRKLLGTFHHLYVQNQESVDLLSTIGKFNISICGDTRFDRVLEVMSLAKPLPKVEQFTAPRNEEKPQVVVIGSSWHKEEEYMEKYIKANPHIRLIIAPHVIKEDHLQEIEGRFKGKVARYTKATDTELTEKEVLMIDCFGVLSSIYRYCDMAVIGGGFISSGIHNVLEAAVYGKATIFGPEYPKFLEAVELLTVGGSLTFDSYSRFSACMDGLLKDETNLEKASKISYDYVHSRAGASEMIIKGLAL